VGDGPGVRVLDGDGAGCRPEVVRGEAELVRLDLKCGGAVRFGGDPALFGGLVSAASPSTAGAQAEDGGETEG
jgi:hypothetical protein